MSEIPTIKLIPYIPAVVSSFRPLASSPGTPLARATKNVKKPQNQMCESSRKA